MIYIYSVGAALLLTALMMIYLIKSGYFDMKKSNVPALRKQQVAIPDGGTQGENAAGESDGEEETAESDETQLPEPPAVYSRRQALLLTEAFFVLSVVLNYLVYIYTVVMPERSQPFLFVKMAIMNAVIGAAALTDYKRRKIPNALIIFGLICRAVIYILEFIFTRDTFLFTLKNDGLGFLLGFVVLFVVALISHGGIGYGDVKLFGVLGLMAGSSGVFTTIFVSLVINSVCALGLIAAKKKTFKSSLPMAPFIYAGFVIVSILGLF